MKKTRSIILFLFVACSVIICGQDENKQYLLASIVFEEPQKEFGYYYEYRPSIVFISLNSDSHPPQYYDPFINLIDSINYIYNDWNYLSEIKIFRKNTIESIKLSYGQLSYNLLDLKRESFPEDRYNENENIRYNYSIWAEDKSSMMIHSYVERIGALEKKESFLGRYLVDQNSEFLKEIIEGSNKKEFVYDESNKLISINEQKFYYNSENIFLSSNYGKTPQWICMTLPDLWVFSPNLSEFEKRIGGEGTFNVKIEYKYGKYNLPTFAIERYYDDKNEVVKKQKYYLRYIQSK